MTEMINQCLALHLNSVHRYGPHTKYASYFPDAEWQTKENYDIRHRPSDILEYALERILRHRSFTYPSLCSIAHKLAKHQGLGSAAGSISKNVVERIISTWRWQNADVIAASEKEFAMRREQIEVANGRWSKDGRLHMVPMTYLILDDFFYCAPCQRVRYRFNRGHHYETWTCSKRCNHQMLLSRHFSKIPRKLFHRLMNEKQKLRDFSFIESIYTLGVLKHEIFKQNFKLRVRKCANIKDQRRSARCSF